MSVSLLTNEVEQPWVPDLGQNAIAVSHGGLLTAVQAPQFLLWPVCFAATYANNFPSGEMLQAFS